MSRPSYFIDLPQTAYAAAYDLQRAIVEARTATRLDRDVLLMLEHPPVYTLGRRGGRENLMVPESFLKERGIDVVPIERGGNITFHGPGQLVVYLLMDLKATRIKVVEFVAALEKAMIRTAAHWRINAHGDATFRGAWVQGRKLGSVGITVRRGVTFHGLALNVNTDLEPFNWINPCGIKQCAMTSLAQEIGRPVDMREARQQMARHLSTLFDLALHPIDVDTLKTYL